ncbi:Arv1-domain-containing protein [Thelephora ganbajun]|uniref:Arv1-domain-containing protein n=1 Tax=Thelephora ganbajun TaxID=370292 RepID=A0ACB6ZGQ3_THEGA|nr:Arv1-domain-containing protein [Thelephora ganbajun]
MPICIHCGHPTPYLYTVYQSAYNFRLEQCPSCKEFADPHVQHDTTTLLLDLILLKRDVYRHLLFNRGTGARIVYDAVGTKSSLPQEKEEDGLTFYTQARWRLIMRLGAALIWVDAFIRWTHLNIDRDVFGREAEGIPWSQVETELCLRVFVGCIVETLAFHGGVTLGCYTTLRYFDWYNSRKKVPTPPSGIRQQFRFSHVPLTLLYSSLSKLFLLFLLSIWRPSTTNSTQVFTERAKGTILAHPIINSALEILDDDKLDKEWVIRNILGGMAAGFGLRVVLDCHPSFTTVIILVGWGAKTGVARFVSSWLGGDQKTEEIWLSYSIP